jgi:hypothetical protein
MIANFAFLPRHLLPAEVHGAAKPVSGDEEAGLADE